MRHHITTGALAAACALLLAGCGGATNELDSIPAVSRVDLLASQARGMESIVFSGGSAFVALGNAAKEGTAVLKAGLPLSATSSWSPVGLGACALGPHGDMPVRVPKLKMAGETMWLMQWWQEAAEPAVQEHSACVLAPQANAFVPRDQGLRACNEYFCSTLSMNDIKLAGNRLYSNAGAGENLFASSDNGASWRVVRGQFDSMICTHTSFEVIGDRVLVGGECPLDDAFLDAYQLAADGMSLAKPDKLALTTPELENRNVQFIQALPGAQRVFVGVEGGLLRSEDGGRSFKFVIHNPVEGASAYPYVKSLLALKNSPDTLVIGGFDKKNFRPYLAFSRDGGSSWNDVSNLLPGFSQPQTGDMKVAVVNSLAEDPEGRIIVVMNEREDSQGRILLLTLGRR
jgi:hypothetical protein